MYCTSASMFCYKHRSVHLKETTLNHRGEEHSLNQFWLDCISNLG